MADDEATEPASPTEPSTTEPGTSNETAARETASTSSSTEAANVEGESSESVATEPAAGPAAAQPAPPGSSPARSPWALVAAVTAVVVVLAVVGAVVGVLWWKLDDRDEQLATRGAATRAACDFGQTVGTYDAKSPQSYDDWINRVRARSTGDWLTMFDGSSAVLKDLSVSAQVHAEASEVHCAWESGDRGRAVVLLSITQTQSSAASPRPVKVSLSGDVTLLAQHGHWLVGTFSAPEDGAGLPGAGGMPPGPAAPAPAGAGQNPPPGQPAPPRPAR